jgi:hypothetical protein
MWGHTRQYIPFLSPPLISATLALFNSSLCSALLKTKHRFPSQQTLPRSRYLFPDSKTALGTPANGY